MTKIQFLGFVSRRPYWLEGHELCYLKDGGVKRRSFEILKDAAELTTLLYESEHVIDALMEIGEFGLFLEMEPRQGNIRKLLKYDGNELEVLDESITFHCWDLTSYWNQMEIYSAIPKLKNLEIELSEFRYRNFFYRLDNCLCYGFGIAIMLT